MGEIPDEKREVAAEAFRESDTNLGVWDELADELESGATTEELGSVDSTRIAVETHENGKSRVVKGSDGSLEIRTSNEELMQECRDQESETNLTIVEDPPDMDHLTAKSPDRETLWDQLQ